MRYAETMTESIHAAFGPFFEVEIHDADDHVEEGWLTMTAALLDDTVLTDRVERVRRALGVGTTGTVHERVAASVTHLGLVARLIAPSLGAAVSGTTVSLKPDHVWWRDELGGPFPLSVVLLGAVDTKPGAVDVDLGAVGELSAWFARRYPLSMRVLGGNVASAINSAARMIGMAVPDLADAALLHADRFLAHPDIEGGQLRAGPAFRRRSCCLIYQVSGDRTAVCGDCVLA